MILWRKCNLIQLIVLKGGDGSEVARWPFILRNQGLILATTWRNIFAFPITFVADTIPGRSCAHIRRPYIHLSANVCFFPNFSLVVAEFEPKFIIAGGGLAIHWATTATYGTGYILISNHWGQFLKIYKNSTWHLRLSVFQTTVLAKVLKGNWSHFSPALFHLWKSNLTTSYRTQKP